jgi:hypothetical protein
MGMSPQPKRSGTIRRTKKQHYVPQFLLRKFAASKESPIWTYDKHTGKSFQQNIKDAAEENYFYDIEFDGQVISLEELLAYKENHWAERIDQLLEVRDLSRIGQDSILEISRFIAVQFTRTKQHREIFREMTAKIRSEVLRRFPDAQSYLEYEMPDLDAASSKAYGLKAILQCQQIIPHLLSKDWLLFEVTTGDPLFVSDSPVVMDNQRDFGWRGNIGYGVPGIEIYIPISPDLVLGLFCPSIVKEIADELAKFEILNRRNPEMLKGLEARHMLDNVKQGRPIPLKAENIERLNSLQVSNSHRFLYSRKDNFDLAKEMIRRDSSFKRGRGIQIG